MRGTQRRWFSISFTLLCLALTAGLLQFVRDRLGDESTFTGWTLLSATAGLYLLTARKKMIRQRLGPVAGWLQMHMYMGVFASCVFLMHIGWPIRGIFETALASAFVFVAVSGILLGVISRTTPMRLAAIKQDFPYERIPQMQLAVATDAHEVALDSTAFDEGATLSEYYQRRLLPYFQTRRGFFYVMFPTGGKRRALLRELADLDRYLGEYGVGSRKHLAKMVQAKDDLDYHQALQKRLQLMFMAHVALTWALAILIGVHVVMVYRFQGFM
ncbi:MAG: hypothetical protein AAF483_11745 [Planctomycetota bacterium]